METRIPAWTLAVAAAVLVAAGCAGRGRPSAEPPRSPATTSPAEVASPDPGPTDGPSAPSTDPRVTPGPPPAGRSSRAEPDFSGSGCFPDVPTPAEVRVEVAAARPGRPLRVVVEIHPTDRFTVEHRHGQEFDVSVDRDGREVWRWSTVAPFVDPYGYRFTYEPGVVRRFTAVWDGAPYDGGPPPGEYVLHGFLVADMVDPPPAGRFICFGERAVRIP